jgi:hypothetical protein
MPYTTEVSMTLLSMEIFQNSPTNIKCMWQISPRIISKTSRKIKMYKDNIQNKQKNKDVQGQYPKQAEK